MKAEITNIDTLLGHPNRTIKVPVYQRDYNWKKEHCKRLFEDIVASVDNKKPHFLGGVLDQEDAKEMNTLILIDGQQRITSILLALKALSNVLNPNNDDELMLINKINETYLTNKYKKTDKFKLKPNEKDADTFFRVIREDNSTSVENSDNDNDNYKNSNIYKNYVYFLGQFKGLRTKGYNYEEILSAIESMTITETRAASTDNAQQIFESLNSTGLELSPHEIIINYMLMPLSIEEQEKIYSVYLKEMDKILTNKHFTDFLMYYFITKRRSDSAMGGKLNKDKLYEMWKREFPNTGDFETRENEFKELARYAKYYENCIPTTGISYKKLNQEKKNLYGLFTCLKQKAASITVMFVYDLYYKQIISYDNLVDILTLIVSHAVRSMVCGKRGLYAQPASLLLQRINLKSENIVEEFEKGLCSFGDSVSFPNDVLFKNALETKELFSNTDLCKYILYSLEEHSGHAKELPEYEEGSIEHIMPQTLSNKWKNYLKEQNNNIEEFSKYLHLLGNLSLTGYNSELGNKIFHEKQTEYSLSHYHYTKELVNYKDWNYDNIVSRGKELIHKATIIWKLSDKYQSKQNIEVDKEYDLFYQPDLFVGSQPVKMYFIGEEKSLDSWRQFVRETLILTKEYDEENFDRIAHENEIKTIIYSIKKPNKVQGEWEICENYWYVGNGSCKDLLTNLQNFLQKFDKDLLDEISFTVTADK